MPQFELENVGPSRVSGLYRGRDAEDAIRRALESPPSAVIELGEPVGASGWREVTVDDRPAGRARPHQRMRFRRD